VRRRRREAHDVDVWVASGQLDAAADRQPPAREPRWTLGDAFWLILPILSVLGVIGYFAASISLGTTPPFSVVDGQSMRPNFHPGDLVVIRGISAEEVEVGDVIAITPPLDQQEEKGLPSDIVHRVVEKSGEGADVTFATKGDNVGGNDAFVTRPGNIRGEVIHRIPGAGYPVLFARSEQGRIFGAALALAIIGYFVIAAIERRQEAAQLENPRRAIAELAAETEQLRRQLAEGEGLALPPELHRLVDEQQEQRDTIRQLVDAVGEYGRHLRSHTAVVQTMASASQQLASAAGQLSGAARAGDVVRGPAATADTPFPPLFSAARADERLGDWLAERAYQDWSLVAVDEAAGDLAMAPAELGAALVRLAVSDRLQLRPLQPPALYRYRLG
jgi:signal peptidase I